MKKLSFLTAIVLMAGMSFLSSCTKDATTTPPTILLNAAPGYTGTDVTVPVNTALKVGVIAQSTSAKLTKFEIIQTINGTPSTLWDTTFSVDAYNDTYNISAPPVVGSVTLTFKITAADGEMAQASFTITTTSAPIFTYTAILIGGQLNPNLGSFYSTEDNSVMKLAVATASPAKVDLAFYYGDINKATISAPADEDMPLVHNFAGIANWTTRNATKMKLVTTAVDWAAITDESGILANATDLTETKIVQLEVGNTIAFETASTSTNPGKKGMFKIIELNGTTIGTDRSVKIEVKIQE